MPPLLRFQSSRGRIRLEGDSFNGGPWFYFLQSFHNDPLTRCNARRNKPGIADGAIDFQHPDLDFILSVYNQSQRIAPLDRVKRPVGERGGLSDSLPSSTEARTNMPGNRTPFELGKTMRRMTDPVV